VISLSRSAFITLLALACIAAVVFRFPNLGDRLLWQDEAISVLRAAGYTQAQLIKTFDDGRTHSVAEMRAYQGHGSTQPAAAVVYSSQAEDPQHPPLYYLLLHFWQHAFGGAMLWQRLLSVLIGIALIPAMYWLGLELFDSRRTAAIGAALMAASPFFVAYSREVRDYGLLALWALVSGALLLRAARSSKTSAWILYAFSAAGGLYTSLLFALALCGHLIFVVAVGRGRKRWAGLAAVAGALALYVPWIRTIVSDSQLVMATNGWSGDTWPVTMLAEKWLFNASVPFFDLEYRWVWAAAIAVPVLLLTLYAVYFTAKNGTAAQRWFIGGMLLPSMVTVGLGDLLLHTHRSAITRYGVIFYLGLLLCMTALLGYKTANARRTAWRVLALSVVTAGLGCCIVSSQSPIWWDNHEDDSIAPVAARVNAAAPAVVIAPAPAELIYTLSFRLKDNVRIMLRAASRKPFSAVSPRPTFIVTTGWLFHVYMMQRHGIVAQPLYVASYGPVWEAFHRPLARSDLEAPGVKLSMWVVVR